MTPHPAIRRLLATAGGAVLVTVLAAAPAAAHAFDDARLDSPTGDEPYDEPPAVIGHFAHDGSGVGTIDLGLALVGRTGPEEPPGEDPCAAPSLAPVDGGGQERFAFELALPTLACNGEYSVTATARSRPHPITGSVTTATVSASFALAAPPATPGAVDARLDEDARVVQLAWDPNSEVDLLGYLIERAVGDGDYEVVGDSNEAAFLDEVTDEGGLHTYRVRAVRRGPDADLEAIASDPSGVDAVDVPPAPQDEPAGGDGGGGEDTGDAATPPPSRSVDLSSFGNLQNQAQRPVQSSPRVTVDTGFEPTLPFQAPPPTAPPDTAPATTAVPEPAGDVAIIEYEDSGGGPDAEAVMAPAAGALALLVGSLQMRYLLRRASVPAPD